MAQSRTSPLQNEPNRRPAAFFDFDKTLLDTESSRLGIRYMRERRLISLGFVFKVIVANFLYGRQWLTDEQITTILIKLYRHRKLADFRAGADDFYTSCLKPRLAPRVLERLHWHQNQNHLTVLVSGSLRYMLESVVADVGIDHLLCSDLEEGPDGLLTGKLNGPLCMGDQKRFQANQLSKAIGIDLGGSYAYGDHHSDLPLLKLVGFPHAVEPDPPLRRVAKENNWPILTFR